jgi:hypothetical protein
LKINHSLRIMGHNITVKYPHVFAERNDCHALACLETDQILIAGQTNGEPLSEASIAENYLHEICHHVAQIVTSEICLGGDEVKHSMICRVLFQVIRDNDLDFREGRDD